MSENKWLRNSFVWIIIMAAMLLIFFMFLNRGTQTTEIPISQVVADIRAGNVAKIKSS